MIELTHPLDQLFKDKDGRIVIIQWPNFPLSLFLLSWVVSPLVHGLTHTLVSGFGTLALEAWAVIEVISGLSLFRRLFGGLVLIGFVISLIRLLVTK